MTAPDHLLPIALMALVLFVTRVAGLYVARWLPDSPRVAALLDALPGITMVAIVVPLVVASGPVGVVAAIIVGAIVRRTGNLALAMGLGVALVALAG